MLKEDELLKFYMKHTGVELFSKNMFGMKFYVLTWEELRSLANWIQSMLIRLSAYSLEQRMQLLMVLLLSILTFRSGH